MAGKLYLCATPIGNLDDITLRVLETLKTADLIAAEDTRHTIKLLNHFEIKKPMISYFEHNRKFHGELICQKIEAGENCALVSDAGMPAISDPGEDLVRLCGERGITVSVVPGPSALIAALAVSGLPTGRFTFEGFLSTNKKSRRDHLEQVKNETRTMIFYEAPHKLHACLRDMYAAWGDRRIAVVHELTKIHEEVIRTTLKAAAARYSEGNIKGEFVLVIEGTKPEELQEGYTLEQAVEIAAGLMREQGMSASEAAKTASQQTGLKKGDIYKGALALK